MSSITIYSKKYKFLAQEEVWIRKGIQARRTRNEGRVRHLHELPARGKKWKMTEIIKPQAA